MERLMFTNNDLSTELAWEVLKKQQACWHTDYCTVSCEECENYVTHRDLEKAIDIIIEERMTEDDAETRLMSLSPECDMGKWILLDECSNSGYYCSKCRKKLVKEGWSNTVKKINYCPNCGKKMEKWDEAD